MGIKRVLLPMSHSEELQPIVEAAFVAGRLLQAEVRGLHVEQDRLDIAFAAETTSPEAARRLLDQARKAKSERRKRAGEMFASHAQRFANVESEFVTVEGDVGDSIAHAARLSDIAVLGAGSAFAGGDWFEIRDAALFRSGRPVLFVPPAGVSEPQFDRVVIAWKESMEAARALAAAQSLLLRAKEVVLFSVGNGPEFDSQLAEVEAYLQLHYAEIRSETMPSSSKPVGAVLLERVAEKGGAVLVMGAYSHWRWREQIFGGATEYVLRHADTPVLMAH